MKQFWLFGNKNGSLLSQRDFMWKIHLITMWILLNYYILWSSGEIVLGINTTEIFIEKTLKGKIADIVDSLWHSFTV